MKIYVQKNIFLRGHCRLREGGYIFTSPLTVARLGAGSAFLLRTAAFSHSLHLKIYIYINQSLNLMNLTEKMQKKFLFFKETLREFSNIMFGLSYIMLVKFSFWHWKLDFIFERTFAYILPFCEVFNHFQSNNLKKKNILQRKQVRCCLKRLGNSRTGNTVLSELPYFLSHINIVR